MTIQFNQIPANIRVPFMYFEINPGQAPYVSNARVLLIGQKTTAGTAVQDAAIQVTGGEDGLFGINSQLAAMYVAARKVGALQEIWAVPLADAGGSAASLGAINLNRTADANGTLVYYIGDVRVQVPYNNTMTVTAAATALIAGINACPGMQVTASSLSTGAKSVGTQTIVGTATAAGIYTFALNNVKVNITVPIGMTAALLAAAIVAGGNATPGISNYVILSNVGGVITLTALSTGTRITNMQIAAASTATGIATPATTFMIGGVGDVVRLTANNKGTLGNTIGVDYSVNPLDPGTATYMTTLVAMAGGASDPAITNALANLGDQEFDWIAMPYPQYYSQLEAFLEARWAYSSQVYGFGITAYEATAGALSALGAALNGPYIAILGVYNIPAPAYLWVAQVATICAVHLQSPPELSRPLQTLPLIGMSPANVLGNRWTALERQSFYFSGISACTERRDGTVVIDRLISTYQTDVWGSQDSTWLDVNTLAQVMYGTRYLKQLLSSTYPRVALANQNPNNLQGVVTAADLRNTIIHGYKQLCDLGVFDDADLFAQLLVVERNSQDPDRVDCYLPVETVGQLRILAANMSVYLQYQKV